MPVRRTLISALGSLALVLTSLGAATATAGPAAADPCGFFKTGSDAYYNHCTSDGSRIVIKVDATLARDYERCVGPGKTWLGSASKIRGAAYTGRTC